jgi:hypothetical protein
MLTFVHRDGLNKDQLGDLESLGYPKPPSGEWPVNIVAIHVLRPFTMLLYN